MFVSVLAAMAIGVGKIDGEEAMGRATRLLNALGVEEDLHLLLLQHRDATRQRYSRSMWLVSFTMPGGVAAVQLDDKTGRPIEIEVPFKAKPPISNEPPTKAGTAFQWTAMKKLGFRTQDLRLGGDVGFANSPSGGEFYLLAHGLRFFNLNPTYAHSVGVDPVKGSIRSFRTSLEPPEVTGWTAKVPAKVAVEKIRAWAHARAVKKGYPKQIDPSEGVLNPELGYWQFQNESKARLVWRVTRFTSIHGQPYGMGALRMFVDAVDGSLREPDDNAWGANP